MRLDGYLQLREGYRLLPHDPDRSQKQQAISPELDGLIPATLINIENGYRIRDIDDIGRKILRGRT